MKKPADLRSKLEAGSQGKAPRPRGNAVTSDEYGAVAPFAKALDELVDGTLYAWRHDLDREYGDDDASRVAAPSAALPPLP